MLDALTDNSKGGKMSDDTEILLMKIERQVSRICKALEDKAKDGANEEYLRGHIFNFLKSHFPQHLDAGAAREYFERTIGADHTAMNVGVNSDTYEGAVEVIPVPKGVARSLFIVGWMAAMKNIRREVQP